MVSKAKRERAAKSHVKVPKSELREIMAELEEAEKQGVALPEENRIMAAKDAEAETRWLVYLENLKHGSRISAAAKAAGIPYNAICARRAVDPDFVKAERMAEMEASEVVENALWKAAANGESWAVMTWLQNRAPDRWKDQRRPDRQVMQIVEGDVNMIDANSSMDRVGLLMEKLDARRRAQELPAPGFIDVESTEVQLSEDEDQEGGKI